MKGGSEPGVLGEAYSGPSRPGGEGRTPFSGRQGPGRIPPSPQERAGRQAHRPLRRQVGLHGPRIPGDLVEGLSHRATAQDLEVGTGAWGELLPWRARPAPRLCSHIPSAGLVRS